MIKLNSSIEVKTPKSIKNCNKKCEIDPKKLCKKCIVIEKEIKLAFKRK